MFKCGATKDEFNKTCLDEQISEIGECLRTNMDCEHRLEIDDKSNKQVDGAVQTKPIKSIVMQVKPGIGLKFDICPFCFIVYIFDQDIINTKKHACACGARFTSLGHATKFIPKEG